MAELTRWDEDGPLQGDYLDDCHYCGDEQPRSELAWAPDLEHLICHRCEDGPSDEQIYNRPGVEGGIPYSYDPGEPEGGYDI